MKGLFIMLVFALAALGYAATQVEKKQRFACYDKEGFPILLMRTADKPRFVSATISCHFIDVLEGGR